MTGAVDPKRLASAIGDGAAALGLDLGAGCQLLARYLGLLQRWNRAYNLTAVRDPAEMVPRHILDSLAVVPFVHGRRVLDVGSGAGLPGIPLAVALPELDFHLLDASLKRTRFMEQARIELGLANVTVIRSRVEDLAGPWGFDSVISRAFASLEDFVSLCGPLCQPQGRLLAMKGQVPRRELPQLPAGWRLEASHRLHVPGLSARRSLLVLAPGNRVPG